MLPHRWPGWNAVLPPAWGVLLALLPWWFGLPLLLALVVELLLQQLTVGQTALLRRGLRWGLPGMLLALLRSLGGDALAWSIALLGALAGYTLLAGLDAWLGRGARHASGAASTGASTMAEWSELALAPMGPAATIIELQWPVWQAAVDGVVDPHGERVDYRDGSYRLADGRGIDRAGPAASFSPEGDWLAARMDNDRGLVLWQRARDRRYRLRGWQLCGWYHEQPWLVRREGDAPLALAAVLGLDDEERGHL